MKVIVCGGRNFSDRKHVFDWLDKFHQKHPISHLIHGGARGVDRFAFQWCMAHGVRHSEYPADWITYGRSAGPRRNQQMLNQSPDAVIAFPGGTGTADMVNRAKNAGVKVYDESKDL